MEFVFDVGGNLLFVRVFGQEVTFSGCLTNGKFISFNQMVDVDKSITNKAEVKRKWKKQLTKLGTEKKVEKYVRSEMERRGLRFIRRKD